MTINDSANLPDEGGSKTADLSTDINNPDNLNFWEPGDDEANPDEGNDGIDGEAGEVVNDGQETADTENLVDGENGAGDDLASDAIDETIVTLRGGEQVPVKELKLGYLRERDYRMKTMDVANKSRGLGELSNRVAGTAQAIAKFLAEQLPQEPDTNLAMSDPGEYTRQKAFYDAALARVGALMDMATGPQKIASQLTAEQHGESLRVEFDKLAAAFPQTRTDEGREKFFEEAFDTARQLGFADEEMQAVTDHRYFKLAHYARLGMAAEKAKKTALQKVENAPAAVPRGRAQGQNAQQVRNSQDAMKRLERTGSIKDAMAIDF